jgi:hypothetical protein
MAAISPLTSSDRDELVQRLLRAIEGISFGSVEIVIHDSRVVQIERKEKLRFEPPPRPGNR